MDPWCWILGRAGGKGPREETGLSLAGQVWRHWHHSSNSRERITEQTGTQAVGKAGCVWSSLSLGQSSVFKAEGLEAEVCWLAEEMRRERN